MPVLERDPWRYQYFEHVACPDDVLIPTDDPDCWNLHTQHRWVYDKLRVAASQDIACGPHGVWPDRYPVFSKPIINLKGMGVGSRLISSAGEMDRHYQPGHMWMEYLEGPHVSTDCAVLGGEVVWMRHATGVPWIEGTFRYWTIHADPHPELDAYLSDWVKRHMAGFTGMMNFETISRRIIEAHLRFADQWCDLYGSGWVEALVALYAEGRWDFDDTLRADGYSVPLFATHGAQLRHPPKELQAEVRAMAYVKSLQITFHETKSPDDHPMPPGGFRLAVVNATSLDAAMAARRRLADAFPPHVIMHQD